ncbi:hypothetical protein ACFQX7_32160 [Luedemannella flava]
MTVIPQSYPLWLAQIVDGEVQAGFIVAWTVVGQSARDADQVAQPIVTFTDDNCFAWGTMPASRTAPRFICDNRTAAMDAADAWLTQRRLGGRGATPLAAPAQPQLDGGPAVPVPSLVEDATQPSSSST